MKCLTAGCDRSPRPGYAHCDVDTERLLLASLRRPAPRPTLTPDLAGGLGSAASRDGASASTRAPVPDSDVARFWAKVDRSGDCWLWTGSVTEKGYGRFATGDRHKRAHRFVWQLVFGPVPAGLVVMHRCDTPACVRPDHLRLGTVADNQLDMVEKGRSTAGRSIGSRFSPEQLDAMFAMADAGTPNQQIARAFHVHGSTIGRRLATRRGQGRRVSRSAAHTPAPGPAGEQGHGPLFRAPVPGALSGSGGVPPFAAAPTLART